MEWSTRRQRVLQLRSRHPKTRAEKNRGTRPANSIPDTSPDAIINPTEVTRSRAQKPSKSLPLRELGDLIIRTSHDANRWELRDERVVKRLARSWPNRFSKERNHRRGDRLRLLQRGQMPSFLYFDQGSIRQSSCNLLRIRRRKQPVVFTHDDQRGNLDLPEAIEYRITFSQSAQRVGASTERERMQSAPSIRRSVVAWFYGYPS